MVPAGRTDTFVPIDTENLDAEKLQLISDLVAEAENASGQAFHAVVSTKGHLMFYVLLGRLVLARTRVIAALS